MRGRGLGALGAETLVQGRPTEAWASFGKKRTTVQICGGISVAANARVCVCVCAEGSIGMCERTPAVQTTRRARPLQRESRGGPAVPFTSCAPVGPAFDASAPEGGQDACGSLTARPGVHLCLPPPASWGPFWSSRPGKGPSVYHCPHFQFPVHPTSPACHQDHCHPSGTSLSQRPGMCLDFRACLRSVPPGTTPLMGQLPGPPLPPAQLLCPGHPEWPGHPLGLEFPALDDASVSHLPQAPPSTGTGPAGGSMPLCGRTPSSRARRSEEGSRLSGEGLSRCPADSASL